MIQRVSRASVRVRPHADASHPSHESSSSPEKAESSEEVGSIARGLLVLLGVGRGDTEREARWMAHKIAGLRVFPDSQDRMNLSVRDIQGAVLVVSQFTLFGEVERGFRPSFSEAAPPEIAETLYERFCELLQGESLPVERGRFRAMMDVELVNDGPVTILLQSAACDESLRRDPTGS